MDDYAGTTWPPCVVHRRLWDLVGGQSIEFSPGLYQDPDFGMKLWQAGVRCFKGVGRSRVYHFMGKSTGRVVRNDGRGQFMRKWGVSASRFRHPRSAAYAGRDALCQRLDIGAWPGIAACGSW